MTESDLVGRSAERSLVITDELVRQFADVVGDHNPLHIDDAAARASRFGGRIAHGMLLGSLFSGLIAHELPGAGSIYVAQELRFRRPVGVGDLVIARVECTSVDEETRIVKLATSIVSGSKECVVGEATVLLDR